MSWPLLGTRSLFFLHTASATSSIEFELVGSLSRPLGNRSQCALLRWRIPHVIWFLFIVCLGMELHCCVPPSLDILIIRIHLEAYHAIGSCQSMTAQHLNLYIFRIIIYESKFCLKETMQMWGRVDEQSWPYTHALYLWKDATPYHAYWRTGITNMMICNHDSCGKRCILPMHLLPQNIHWLLVLWELEALTTRCWLSLALGHLVHQSLMCNHHLEQECWCWLSQDDVHEASPFAC